MTATRTLRTVAVEVVRALFIALVAPLLFWALALLVAGSYMTFSHLWSRTTNPRRLSSVRLVSIWRVRSLRWVGLRWPWATW